MAQNSLKEELEAREARLARREKERAFRKKLLLILAGIIVLLALLILLTLGMLFYSRMKSDAYSAAAAETVADMPMTYVGEKTETEVREAIIEPVAKPDKLVPTLMTGEVVSANVYMYRPEDQKEILNIEAEAQIYPASMTKMMTALIAIEELDLKQTHFVMYDEVSLAVTQDATRAGFSEGEEVTIEDLLYGALLPSGAECCYALASEVIEKQAGSTQWDYETRFVELMNKKAAEIGMKNTQFTNCVGVQSPDHYSTCKDMAKLLEYGLNNETFKTIISTHTYTTTPTEYHPDGLALTSTMFASMGSSILPNETSIRGGKTGYTDEAGHCLASYADTEDETRYILVTGGGYTEVNDYSNISDAKYLYGQLPRDAYEGE
ncbi:MAG: D-alanyl-D-alanine carboxypeptidase [Eubacterium sp.]|nr:D-alanyl-D-alanine carboxypeptidase [Eubacterium sp.]